MTKKRTYVHIASIYDLLDLPFESGRYRPIRRILFEGVHGTILDAGVGTGIALGLVVFLVAVALIGLGG